jgi:hypothetical protein
MQSLSSLHVCLPAACSAYPQAFHTLWLFLTGGPAVLKMAAGYMLGQQKAVVQGGLDSGVLEYHVIVAKKPGK